MADRPILFSGPMVRALLDGRKTQTRRVLANVPPMPVADCHPSNRMIYRAPYLDAYCGERKTAMNPRGMGPLWNWWQVDDRCCLPQFRVGYVPGDRLWVRETWAPLNALTHNVPGTQALADRGFYRADGGTVEGEISRWRPSIHMPRRASRLTLLVTQVRVERLQDISEDDAEAEGCRAAFSNPAIVQVSSQPRYRWGYHELWDELNAKRDFGWDANPWVVAVTFTVHHQNIDAPGAKEAA